MSLWSWQGCESKISVWRLARQLVLLPVCSDLIGFPACQTSLDSPAKQGSGKAAEQRGGGGGRAGRTTVCLCRRTRSWRSHRAERLPLCSRPIKVMCLPSVNRSPSQRFTDRPVTPRRTPRSDILSAEPGATRREHEKCAHIHSVSQRVPVWSTPTSPKNNRYTRAHQSEFFFIFFFSASLPLGDVCSLERSQQFKFLLPPSCRAPKFYWADGAC